MEIKRVTEDGLEKVVLRFNDTDMEFENIGKLRTFAKALNRKVTEFIIKGK